MKTLYALIASFAFFSPLFALLPEDVIVIYNSQSEVSKNLADYYVSKRNIPQSNLFGIKMPLTAEITRDQFTQIHEQIQGQLSLIEDSDKVAIVLTKGVPYKVKGIILKDKVAKSNPLSQNFASFDSEIAAKVTKFNFKGTLRNQYFRADIDIKSFKKLNGFTKTPILVTRLDGPTLEICKSRIDDTLETEKTGLWGMTYLDKAFKGAGYVSADIDLDQIEKINWNVGFPTIKENTPHTFPSHYPMDDAAIYFGWYASNASGPLNNPHFKFKKGAIATHIHSFSAHTLESDKKNWVAPLVSKGACAVLGNVYEPFLIGTTQLDIFHARLLSGFSFAEAAYMATPLLSWQTVMIGDPLYTPFIHLKKRSGITADEDKIYRALNLIFQLEVEEGSSKAVQLENAAIKSVNSKMYESIAYWNQFNNKPILAQRFLNSAIYLSKNDSDRSRGYLQKAYYFEETKHVELVVQILEKALIDHPSSTHTPAVKAMLKRVRK